MTKQETETMQRRKTFVVLTLILSLGCLGGYAFAADGPSILKATGTHGGLVVHVGCGDGQLTAGLLGGPGYLVHGLDADPDNVAKARAHVRGKGLYGKISVDLLGGKSLPYVDNIADLVVVSGSAKSIPKKELMRVLAPGGSLYLDGSTSVKPRPEDIDEWPHYLNRADNNAVAADSRVGPPRHLQWLSHPRWSRHHDKLASISTVVTSKGRLFYIADEGPVYAADYPARWSIAARDAFNGVFLWKRPIPTWTSHKRKFRSGPVQLQRLLVTDGDKVYITLGLDEPVSVLDAVSGTVLGKLDGTEKTEEMLLHQGRMVVMIGAKGAEHALIERMTKGVDYKTTKLIKAIDVKSGKTLWRWPASETAEIMPRSLAVSGDAVFCRERGETMCLSLADGSLRWRTALSKPAAPAKPADEKKGKGGKKTKRKSKGSGRGMGWTFETLVAKDGVVLSCDGKTLNALDAKSGKALWQCAASTPFGRTPSVDILVVNGVVWTSPGFGQGRHLRTGEVVATHALQKELVTEGHHHRCYRNKATERYIIEGYRGLEFMDTKGDNHYRHNWIRGICQYGIMPANGLVYIPPHNCGCYPEAKLFGFWTLSAEQPSVNLKTLAPSSALEKGPAYAKASAGTPARAGSSGSSVDWPMHRHDAARSGVTAAALPSQVKAAWTARIGGRITPPVVAEGVLLVSAPQTHEVVAVDAVSGKEKWRYTAGAPVDSAPTVHAGTALFGSADGYVYCVTVADGQLAWRFRAAPQDSRTVVMDHVESLWPVHGSVLVVDNTAYFVAGRSSYLDGGLFLYGLDPATGAVRYKSRLNDAPAGALKDKGSVPAEGFAQNKVDYKTALGPDKSDAFSMAGGNISDILVADADAVYLRHMKFNRKLQRRNEWTHHLFSTSRLLDDNESHRSHMFFGNGDFSRLPVAYEWLTRGSYGGFDTPLGKLLVFDGKRLWGTNHRKGHVLFACDISGIDTALEKDFPRSKEAKPYHPKPIIPSMDIHPRALIKAGENLVVGGFPAETSAIHEYGKPIAEKGVLMQVSVSSGETISRAELASPPVFDGMAAAGGKLFVSCEDGSIVCLK